MSPQDPSSPEPELPVTLPVVREELHVGTRTEKVGALRVRVLTEEHSLTLEQPLVQESVVVERVSVGVPVAQPREPWHEGEVLVVPVYEEVIERRLVLKEEIRLHRQRFSAPHTEQVPLRRQRAVVERRQADGTWTEVEDG
jgi:stress response protein YsnF